MKQNLKKIKIFNIRILIILLILFYYSDLSSSENRIIFKINQTTFTQLDLEKRSHYLDFVGNNEKISRNKIIDDFISANLFYEYYSKNFKGSNHNEKIKEIYSNILNNNIKNNKNYSYEIDEENILNNIKIDFTRKIILENILNSSIGNLDTPKEEIDLLYNLKIKYVNFKVKDKKLKNKINNLNNINIENLIEFLNENNIEFFLKEKEINNVTEINYNLRKNILQNKNFFILSKNDSLSLIFIEKKFATYDGIIANIFSIRSKNKLDKDYLKCKNLIKLIDSTNIVSKEYRFNDLNDDLKNNLLDIDDYIKFLNNGEHIYVILCEIKFDKDILKNVNLNKIVNLNINNIEKEFVDKYSKIYNLIKLNE